jgi:hypothetical protein
MACRVPITSQLIAALTGGSNGYRQGLTETITPFGAARCCEAVAPARLLGSPVTVQWRASVKPCGNGGMAHISPYRPFTS